MPVPEKLNLTDRSSMVEHNQRADIIGKLPYRMAFAGGWIDQPFISAHNPTPPGAMVVVSLEPSIRFMDRCGMGTSTRDVARQLWGDQIPAGNPALLVRQLYQAENHGKSPAVRLTGYGWADLPRHKPPGL